MILSLLLVAQLDVHTCNHDLEMGNITRELQGPQSYRSLKSTEWKNIRIKVDYNYIDNKKDDERTCKRAGQLVVFQGVRYICKQEHILTYSKILAIKGTLNNVKSYLERLLTVIPYNYNINYVDFRSRYGYETNFGKQSAYGADIVLAVLSRPRQDNDATLASAAGLAEERTYHRPIFGVVFLNPMAVPDTAQDENTNDSRFFYTCVHEIFHALGISPSDFRNYHPHDSITPHSQIKCSFRKYGRDFSFLVTPYAHKFAVKRFGVEVFVGDDRTCPSGLEIENDGGQGTAGSHLEARSYMSDLMVGMTIQTKSGPFARLTDAVLAILLDTGNYKVNWRMGQPLVWGHPESIDGKPIPNFAIGPPQNVFPKYYMRDFSVQEDWYASFDFKFSGPFSGPAHIRASYSEKQFYDPKGIGVGTTQVYDFIPFYFPNYVCPNGQAILPSTMSYYYHKCGTYTCDGYKSFTIQVNKDLAATQFESVTCTKDNATAVLSMSVSGYRRQVSCVDPERFCRSVKLNEMKFVVDPFNPDTRQLNSDSPTPTQPEPDNNPSAPEPGNNPSGPEPGNNPSGPEPGNNPSGPEPGNNPSGPEPGNNPSGPEPGNNPSGPEPGNNPSGPEPGNNPSGPEPGNNPSGPEPGNNPSGPEPGNNPSGPEPGNNPSGPEPGNNPSGPEPGNNPSGPGVENPSGTGGNETTTTGSGGSYENSKAAEKKAKKKKLIIIAACAGVAALIVIAFIAVLVIFAIRNAKENAYHEDSDANYVV